jgi:prolyl-tRNA editing enzyme YbaK/EbsC (Cys-tRNA(Pro) deacylase)
MSIDSVRRFFHEKAPDIVVMEAAGSTATVALAAAAHGPSPVYCDVSLKAFEQVLPAAGAANSAVRISPLRLAQLVGAAWVDVCETDSAPG